MTVTAGAYLYRYVTLLKKLVKVEKRIEEKSKEKMYRIIQAAG